MRNVIQLFGKFCENRFMEIEANLEQSEKNSIFALTFERIHGATNGSTEN